MVVGIASLPVEFFMLIGTSIMTNIFVQLFAKQTNVGNKVVKACMRTMQVFQALVAIASFFSWLFMVEPWALLMDGNSGV